METTTFGLESKIEFYKKLTASLYEKIKRLEEEKAELLIERMDLMMSLKSLEVE